MLEVFWNIAKYLSNITFIQNEIWTLEPRHGQNELTRTHEKQISSKTVFRPATSGDFTASTSCANFLSHSNGGHTTSTTAASHDRTQGFRRTNWREILSCIQIQLTIHFLYIFWNSTTEKASSRAIGSVSRPLHSLTKKRSLIYRWSCLSKISFWFLP